MFELIKTEVSDGQGNWLEQIPTYSDVIRESFKTGVTLDLEGQEVDKIAFIIKTFDEPTINTKITRLAFSNRLSFPEEVAIEATAVTDAELRVILRKLNNATYIDLALAQTRSMLDVLVSKSLLEVSRVDEILLAPITPEEQAGG